MENNKHLPLRDRVTAYDNNFDKFSMYEKVNCITTDSTIPGLAEYPPKGTHTVSSTTLLPTSSTEVYPVKNSQLPLSIQPTYTLLPMIEKVIFNPPATIVLWRDGTKTVVKIKENGKKGTTDKFSEEYGLAMAVAKKFFGKRSKFQKTVENASRPGKGRK